MLTNGHDDVRSRSDNATWYNVNVRLVQIIVVFFPTYEQQKAML